MIITYEVNKQRVVVDEELHKVINSLAREFYLGLECEVDEDFNFSTHTNPTIRGLYAMSLQSYMFYLGGGFEI